MTHPHTTRRRAAGRRVALLVTASLTLTLTPATVSAQPHDPAYPSQAEVDRAREVAAARAGDVARIKTALVLANRRLEAASRDAEIAVEAYNGAMWRLEEAKRELADAEQAAREAHAQLATQREAVGALVAQSYQHGTGLSALRAVMTAEGPEGLLDQYAAYRGAADSMQADYDRFSATETIAEVFEAKARDARAAADRAAAEAARLKDAAIGAQQAAQRAAGSIAAEKDRLIRELARAQNISVTLARKRQTALEEIARRRAAIAAEKRRQAELAALAEKRRQQELAEKRREQDAADDREERDPAPNPPPPPTDPTPPGPRGGVAAVVDFAEDQLGEPYEWASAGPDSWDCSGLTMMAWAQAGVSLPHYSVAQYDATTPISAADLRPGDLVFWGTTDDPSTIHHVALYVGDGMIIHAPRTGRSVSFESMYYWIPPNFFGRV